MNSCYHFKFCLDPEIRDYCDMTKDMADLVNLLCTFVSGHMCYLSMVDV